MTKTPLEQAGEFLAKVTYKPGWRFLFVEKTDCTVTLVVSHSVPDERHGDVMHFWCEPIDRQLLARWMAYPDCELKLKAFVRTVIRKIEAEDTQRWLRFDGRQINWGTESL